MMAKPIEYQLPENAGMPDNWGELSQLFSTAHVELQGAVHDVAGTFPDWEEQEADPDCFASAIRCMERAASDLREYASGAHPA